MYWCSTSGVWRHVFCVLIKVSSGGVGVAVRKLFPSAHGRGEEEEEGEDVHTCICRLHGPAGSCNAVLA